MSNSVQHKNHWPQSHTKLDAAALQQLTDSLLAVFQQTLSEEKIPVDQTFCDMHKNLYTPFCAWLASKQNDRPLVVGINGSQGSGKSTLTRILSDLLEQGFNKKVISFSIDDLYKTSNARSQMARQIHPLFKTRGVPGTHDAELGISILKQLLKKDSAEVKIPVFDKFIDDRLPESEWSKFKGKCDIILFEGWCVGSRPQDDHEIVTPLNELEKNEDPDAIWRSYANQQLREIYTELYSYIDILLMLKIPDFSKVFEWRKLQEKKLRDSLSDEQITVNKTMSESEIDRFIMHYERITRYTLNEMPGRCDIVFELGNNHQVSNVIARCKP